MLFVAAGLLNVVGLMCYINRTNDELDKMSQEGQNRKQHVSTNSTVKQDKSSEEEAYVPQYEYSWSFYLATVSFGLTEVSAVLCIYFYNELVRLARHYLDERSKSKNLCNNTLPNSHSELFADQSGVPHAETFLVDTSAANQNEFCSIGSYLLSANPQSSVMASCDDVANITSSLHNLNAYAAPPNFQVMPLTNNLNHILQNSCSMTNVAPSANNHAFLLSDKIANDMVALQQPIRVQKQNSVSSSASSPPQVAAYCNGNVANVMSASPSQQTALYVGPPGANNLNIINNDKCYYLVNHTDTTV